MGVSVRADRAESTDGGDRVVAGPALEQKAVGRGRIGVGGNRVSDQGSGLDTVQAKQEHTLCRHRRQLSAGDVSDELGAGGTDDACHRGTESRVEAGRRGPAGTTW